MATLSSSLWVALIKIRFIEIIALLERPGTAGWLFHYRNFHLFPHGLEACPAGFLRTDCYQEILDQNETMYEAVHWPV